MAKDGKDTTEFVVQKQSKIWFLIGGVLAAILAYAPALVEKLSGTWAAIGAAVVGGLTLIYKLFVDLNYIRGRSDVKASENLARKK